MKKTQLKEIKGLEIKDLLAKVKKAKEDLAEAFMARSEGAKGSKDVKAIFKKRKDLARMMTILRQKKMLVELESRQKGNI
ncbi:MAG: hypothetical protein CEO21_47 [Microgenomates group bacterium Gr01-1014_80]|nr:MAG: hypothetical protein CEO21_47 [Microgenomates group bacterium Gr01-1014_80]